MMGKRSLSVLFMSTVTANDWLKTQIELLVYGGGGVQAYKFLRLLMVQINCPTAVFGQIR